jgi:hypothetical protein
MKSICWLILALLAPVGYSAEGKRPPLFVYQPDHAVHQTPSSLKSDDAPIAVVPAPVPVRRELRLSDFEKGPKKTWVDSAPIVVWIAGVKLNGMFVTEIADGHLTFLSSGKRLVGYHKRW